MKRLFTNVRWLFATLFVLSATLSEAQYTGAYQMETKDYTYGITPAGANVSDATAAYETWKTNFVTGSGACNGRRVIFDFYSGGLGATDKSETVSEGIAYGMLLAAYRGDQSLFDDLWTYYKSNRNGNGVMNWKIKNCGAIGQNGATDAELDVAMSLIVASEQWQSDNYLNDAISLIRIIREKEFEGFNLKPGDQFGGANLLNASYFTPAYYKVFKEYDGNDAHWDGAVTAGYNTIAGSPGASKGLVPDWSKADGSYSSEAYNYTDDGKSFFFDAVRTPFRSTIDYLWHGTPEALAYVTKFNAWSVSVHGNSTAQVGSKYNMNGDKTQTYHNATFAACFAISAMASTGTYQTYLDNSYTDVKNTNVGYGEYFNATFKAIGLFVMSGNFFLPSQCDKPYINSDLDASFCNGSPVSLSTTVPASAYLWKKDDVQISTNETYSATTAGVYELLTTDADGCVARDKIIVYDDVLTADFTAVPGAGSVVIQENTTGAVSSFSYTLDGAEVLTTGDGEIEILQAGTYTIELTVKNDGFGCADEAVVSKVITVGNGEGFAIDGFNNSEIGTAWIGTGWFEDLPTEYCSVDDAIDAIPSKKVCSANPCGLLEVVCKEVAGNNYQPFGVTFNDGVLADGSPIETPIDLATAGDLAVVKIRIKATKDIELGIGLNADAYDEDDLLVGARTADRIYIPILAGEWLDTTLYLNDQVAAWENLTLDLTAVHAIQFFPYEKGDFSDVPSALNGWAGTNEYDGTITIDYILIGAKAFPAPSFKPLTEEYNGVEYTNFGVFTKDYYPNDPSLEACVVEDEGKPCYDQVPAWKRQAIMCENTLVLNSETCTAEEVKWYKDGALLGTGETYEINSPGTYVVALSNLGGITTDTVVVSGAATTNAAFSIVQDNSFGAQFYNDSEDFNKWEWSFGHTANYEDGNSGIDQTTVWDPAYYHYPEVADEIYTVTLTVEDTICGGIDMATQELTILCNAPDAVTLTSSSADTVYCEGDTVTFSIGDGMPEFTSTFAWYFSEIAPTTIFSEDSSTVEVVFTDGSWGNVKFEAYGGCLSLTSGDSLEAAIASAATAEITTIDVDNFQIKPNFEGSDNGFVWSYGDTGNWEDIVGNEDGAIQTTWKEGYYAYTAEGDYLVSITVTDELCGTMASDDTLITILCNGPEGLVVSSTADATCAGDIVTYSIDAVDYASSYAWFVPENATSVLSADSLSVEVTFENYSIGAVTAEAYGNCLEKTTADSIEIDVINEVVASFSLDEVIADKVLASNTSENAESVQWTIGDYTTTNDTIIHSMKASGDFQLCLTATNTTCDDSEEVCQLVEIISVGFTSGEDFTAEFVAFPNPATTGAIEFSKEITNVTVIDAIGNEILTATSIEILDISNFEAGLYFIQATEGTVRVIVK